jgi:hypothetical protein
VSTEVVEVTAVTSMVGSSLAVVEIGRTSCANGGGGGGGAAAAVVPA